ncbi:Asp-tRNA(Asn)/Glu-tRNA(Gln) amidotransferase subunit GatC [Thermosipho ferrireducens]|uniref:Asp-tRNA(Asn)/Glu-tRNA(Gln) amidotransferase subunit GatC n=1 Tax=Thermosipho ferrireducens TaxID=2571116 RepID=A0ABX7S3Z1_9BACT|nr:Asp-tRNA(Asn)/Glu-tRNA(Gln) amidotransferase subunit GatC [Thermosipho ferrireducens]QTA37119.1 Asp-tRNA(Asn)/Glu-tRNA(Gln) amidotransferase subunit GatC [Thermosipho ferrireducens]
MIINDKIVHDTAMLARIKIDDVELFKREMQKIVDYFEILSELDVSDETPMYNPIETPTTLRGNDVICFENTEKIIQNFPEKEERFIKIPGIHK